MAEKIDSELLAEVRRAEQSGTHREIPVIITLNGPPNQQELEARGLKIIHAIEFLPGVSGTVTTDKLESLAELAQVKTIEFDGEFTVASAPIP